MSKIFVIEDNDDFTNLLNLILRKEGYEVQSYTHGRKALEALILENPDLVLLDVMLPEMTGWDVCQKIRQVTNIPIIFMTAADENRNIRRGFFLGANDYVIKPFDISHLLARIQIHLEEHHRDKTQDMIVTSPIFGLPLSNMEFITDVLMLVPFLDDTLYVYQNHIIPVVQQHRLTIKHSEDFFTGTVMKATWSALYAAKLIVAECTYKDPKVFYALGIAHTLGKKVLLLAQDEAYIPLDLWQYRPIKYEYTPRGMSHLESELSSAIQKLLETS